jgi:2-methylcitrate dehydratase PrpD
MEREAGLDIGAATLGLSTFARDTQWSDIPERVRHEARRSILNIFATGLAGSGEPAIEKSLAALGQYSSDARCSVTGRRERVDLLMAAFVNAMSANIFDFDDTHPNTIIHPTAPIAPALFAYAETTPIDGQSLLRAFIIGAEIECRIGNAVSPSHYARGWHITSTCGVFGAAAAIGVLKGFDVETFAWALGNAAVQACGLVEGLGTMSKSISVGNAARNGVVSALLAAEGFSGPTCPIDGERGFLTVYSDTPNPDALFDGLGETWEIGKNTYKPYPVGVVLNPVMEACIALHAAQSFKVEDVAEVELRGHPLLRQRADRPDVTTGRESQVSAQHAIAIALRRGRAGLLEFNDAAVAETLRDGIRPTIRFVDDESYDIESVGLCVTTQSGEKIRHDISDTTGGSRNPMPDGDIEKKLVALADYGGFNKDLQPLIDAIWSIESSSDTAAIMKLAALE